MGNSCKCRVCKKQMSLKEALKITQNGTNIYFCGKEHLRVFLAEQEKIKEETNVWYELFSYVKDEVLNYSTEEKLPKYLIERLRDIREGTDFVMGIGRYKQSKMGYPYEIILETFKTKNQDIQYYFKTKSFKNERQKINYMMAIIDDSINDCYRKYKQEQKQKKIDESITHEEIEVMNLDNFETNKPQNNAVDLSKFLD